MFRTCGRPGAHVRPPLPGQCLELRIVAHLLQEIRYKPKQALFISQIKPLAAEGLFELRNSAWARRIVPQL